MVAFSRNESDSRHLLFEAHAEPEMKPNGTPDRRRLYAMLARRRALSASIEILIAVSTGIAASAAYSPDTVGHLAAFLASRWTTVIVCSAFIWIVLGALTISTWRFRTIARMEQESQRTDEALRRAERYTEMVRRVSALLAMRGQTTATSERI